MSNTRNCLREFIKYNLSIRNFTVTNQGNYLKAIKGKEKYSQKQSMSCHNTKIKISVNQNEFVFGEKLKKFLLSMILK